MKFKLSEYISLVSCLGVMIWRLTDYFGGMFIYLLSYWLLIILVCLLYFISIIALIIKLIRKGYNASRVNIYIHLGLITFIVVVNLLGSELFKSKKILSGVLKDDQFHYRLTLRKNGNCEMECYGMFGYDQVFHGQYNRKGDLIHFTKVPYDNVKFIPTEIFVDRKRNAIFINKDSSGHFDTEKSYLNYFELDK